MNNEKGLKNNDLFIGGVISLIVLLFNHIGLLNPIYSTTSGLFSSIQSANYKIYRDIENNILFIANLAGIKDELERYKNESEFYRSETERLKLEIESLNKIVEQKSFSVNSDIIPVRVLYYMNQGSVIVINKGEADNIRLGNVLVVNNNLIGKVTKTYQTKSYIELIVSTNSSIPVLVPVDNLKGFLKGQGGNQLFLEDVPNTKQLTKGTLVTTSGSDEMVPYGLIVGTVSEIISSPTDVVQKANVEPIITFNDLSEAYIIVPL